MPGFRRRQLATGILINLLAILLVTTVVGFLLLASAARRTLDHEYGERAAVIAETTASMPEVVACVSAPRACGDEIQAIAERVRRTTGASYVVVIDRQRLRHSHPDSALIGRPVEEPLAVVDGRSHIGVDNGETGRSANGKAPVVDASGAVIGEVSAGLRESSVTSALWGELPTYAAWLGAALAVGVIASLLLATHLKRRTFGLELDEIAQLLQEREATLHGIREGVIAFGPDGRVTTINDEARRLLALGHAQTGCRLDTLVPPGRLHDVLSGRLEGADRVVLTDDFCLVVNRMPVSLAGRPHGSVITLRDQTEMSGLLRELDSVRSLTGALRAQHHEFSNHLHTLAGLLELDLTDDALDLITELRSSSASLSESLRSRIASTMVVGLLVGKAAQAKERGIELTVSEDTWLGDAPERVQALTTIIGNLLDNAFDALAQDGAPAPDARVELSLVEDEGAITLRVADNGPGVPAERVDSIFLDGFSTKPERRGLGRGVGLAIVHRLVSRLGGTITVSDGPGAVFEVSLPPQTLRIVPPSVAVAR